MDHTGKSHSNQPTETICLEEQNPVCECGCPLTLTGYVHKNVSDLDDTHRMWTCTAKITKYSCMCCGYNRLAYAPLVEGSSLGPIALLLVMLFYDSGLTNERISRYFADVCGYGMCANAIWNARRALSDALKLHEDAIKTMIAGRRWADIDETGFNCGDGRRGYAWVVNTPVAVYIRFATSRSAEVLHTYFSWLGDIPVVCDGYHAYPTRFSTIQRC